MIVGRNRQTGSNRWANVWRNQSYSTVTNPNWQTAGNEFAFWTNAQHVAPVVPPRASQFFPGVVPAGEDDAGPVPMGEGGKLGALAGDDGRHGARATPTRSGSDAVRSARHDVRVTSTGRTGADAP